MSTFEAIVDGVEKNHKSVDKLIGLAVTRHLRVLRFVSDMEEVFNEICLAEFINSSCNICLLGYYVIMDWNNHESMKALSLVLPMAMCHYPAVLTAGKMMTMTMDSFSNILKASLTYFNLLREVSTRDSS
ncbi:hypothetical protein KM043_005937 [Ampulex compressa]|nr:hypothetical protein KM043_005937 [Ampulex compressa]